MKKEILITALEAVDTEHQTTDKAYLEFKALIDDYTEDTPDTNRLQDLFNNFYDIDTVEYMAKSELENGGISRIKYFLNDTYLGDDYYMIDGYGNLDNISTHDLECLRDDLLIELTSNK